MKNILPLTGAASLLLLLAACSGQEEMTAKPAPKAAPSAPAPAAKAETKAPAEKAEKAKATKVAGDVGLLDTEKHYLIVVTKAGKLVTIDYDPKFQPVELKPEPAKVSDIGLGSQAVVQYTKQGDKNVATSIEYRPAKGE